MSLGQRIYESGCKCPYCCPYHPEPHNTDNPQTKNVGKCRNLRLDTKGLWLQTPDGSEHYICSRRRVGEVGQWLRECADSRQCRPTDDNTSRPVNENRQMSNVELGEFVADIVSFLPDIEYEDLEDIAIGLEKWADRFFDKKDINETDRDRIKAIAEGFRLRKEKAI